MSKTDGIGIWELSDFSSDSVTREFNFIYDGRTYTGISWAVEASDEGTVAFIGSPFTDRIWQDGSFFVPTPVRIEITEAIPSDSITGRWIAERFTYIGESTPTTPQFLDETGLRALATHIKTYTESRTTYRLTAVSTNTDSVDLTIEKTGGGNSPVEDPCANGHSWNDGEVTTPATCANNGEKTFTCTVCNETRKEVIVATGHAWDNGLMTTAPTFSVPGVMTYTCTVCGATRTEEIPKLVRP